MSTGAAIYLSQLKPDIVCTLIRVDLKEEKIVILQGHNLLGFLFVCFVQKVILLLFLARSQNLLEITVGNKVVQMQTSPILFSTVVMRTNKAPLCLPEVPRCG